MARVGGSSLDESHLTAVLAYSLDTDLTLNWTIHYVHMETEGEEMAPDKALLHSHSLSVLIELFFIVICISSYQLFYSSAYWHCSQMQRSSEVEYIPAGNQMSH